MASWRSLFTAADLGAAVPKALEKQQESTQAGLQCSSAPSSLVMWQNKLTPRLSQQELTHLIVANIFRYLIMHILFSSGLGIDELTALLCYLTWQCRQRG